MDEQLLCPRCDSSLSVISHIVGPGLYFWLCLSCDYAFAELWPGEVEWTDLSREHALAYNEEHGHE